MNTYNTYDFDSEVEFIPNKCCDMNIDMSVISNSIKESVSETMDETLNSTKKEILDAIKDNKHCSCEAATKDDIKHAVCEINHHIDKHLCGVNFKYEFENLNNQIKHLNHHEKHCIP